MDPLRKGQKWILDTIIAGSGFDALHPEADAALQQLGYDATDLKRVFAQVKAAQMLPAAWSSVAGQVEARAAYWRGRGATGAARALYERAMLLYGRTHYSFYGDDPRRRAYRKRLRACLDQVIALSPQRVERVELAFEGKTLHGLFETARDGVAQPCVVFLPGMDMFKEDWHRLIASAVIPRGWAAFALDGPGQGESLTLGLKMTLENYDRALIAVIDWLVRRKEVDPGRIVLFGSSLGSWWAARAAAVEPRIRAVAANMAALSSDKAEALAQAQPSFMRNLMFMTGIADPAEVASFARAMALDDVMPRVTVPFLAVTGECDELTSLEGTLAITRKLGGARELWVYEREFHPIGPTANEWLNASLDWLDLALRGAFGAGYARQLFITRAGEFIDGDGRPPWWDPK
jgi:pimeloyl-ACP methyl ester carboxylesterase